MKLELQTAWLRVLIETFPAWPAIRRYRVAPMRFEGHTGRGLRRRIAGELRHPGGTGGIHSGGTSYTSPQLPQTSEGRAP